MDSYTPKIVDGSGGIVYVEMIVQGRKCRCCKKIMLIPAQRDVFPNYFMMNQESQMKAAGFVFNSWTEVEGEYICVECKAAGKTYFKCELCGEKKSSNKEQERFGSPPDFLCADCYEVVPAKKWEEKKSELEDDHKYDHM